MHTYDCMYMGCTHVHCICLTAYILLGQEEVSVLPNSQGSSDWVVPVEVKSGEKVGVFHHRGESGDLEGRAEGIP